MSKARTDEDAPPPEDTASPVRRHRDSREHAEAGTVAAPTPSLSAASGGRPGYVASREASLPHAPRRAGLDYH